MSYGVNNQYNPYAVSHIHDVATTTSSDSTAMDMSDFLKIMIAQLTNQTIDNQVDDTAFITQMAQFSSLQMMQELQQTVENSMSVSYLGKYAAATRTETVYLTDANGEMYTDHVTYSETGEVTAVDMRNNKLMLQIGNYWFEAKDLLRVSNSPIETTPSDTSNNGSESNGSNESGNETGDTSGE